MSDKSSAAAINRLATAMVATFPPRQKACLKEEGDEEDEAQEHDSTSGTTAAEQDNSVATIKPFRSAAVYQAAMVTVWANPAISTMRSIKDAIVSFSTLSDDIIAGPIF